MIDLFIGIAIGVLLIAVPAFVMGIISARQKDNS
jgi:hypothetical protein